MDASQTYHRQKHRFAGMHASNNERVYSPGKIFFITFQASTKRHQSHVRCVLFLLFHLLYPVCIDR